MADGQRTLGRPAIVAICFAVAALLTSIGAVIVVARRDRHDPTRVAAITKPPARAAERTIQAADILKLKRDVVEPVETGGAMIGVKIKDTALRDAFGLEAEDVITAINGRAIKREFDVFDAVLGMSTMNASIVYLEVTRDRAPVLLRWEIEGDLRTSRYTPSVRPDPYGAPNPFTTSLVDTIRKLDALHYEIPKSTIDQLLANPDTFARQARIVPSMANGRSIGFKLYSIRSGSVWSALGLANGDTMRSINGQDLSTPDRVLEVYTKLKNATALQILVLRRSGIEESISIAIK